MLKSERGMSRLELVITIASIMFIVACTIVLCVGEDGLSFLPKGDKSNNTVNETNTAVEESVTNETNETVEEPEIEPAANKITNDIQNIIDDTV